MNLQPGPELDIYIEINLFGKTMWEETRGEYKYIIFQQEYWKPKQGHETRYRRVNPSDIDYREHIIPHLVEYSRDWSAMQLVVEEMQRRGFKFMLIQTDNQKWKAVFYNGITRSHIYAEAFEDTAPHAVCMAALSALGALEGQEDET